MGFFSSLGTTADNWVQFKGLDSGSDLHIANICKFEPLLVDSKLRKAISEAIKQMMVSNIGPQYSVEDVALAKLIMYCRIFLDHYGASDENSLNIAKGIRKLLSSEDVNPSISLEARILIMDNFPRSDM